MPDAHRLDDLRRRVQQDPASLVFAHLAEECRRAGALDEAIRVCRAGLTHHPEYLSARVTLGRALLARGELDRAQAELALVLGAAPENLAALRGLADIHRLRGDDAVALELYREALALAPGDPDLLQAADQLAHETATVSPDVPDPDAPRGALHAFTAAGPAASDLAEGGPGPATDAVARLDTWLEAIRAARRQREAAARREPS